MWTIVMLCLSNVFMTFAWYGHLRFFKGDSHPLWIIILFSWSIALFEYCLAVPANRIGTSKYHFDPAQLKTIQEIVTLIVFVVFSVLFLKESLRWNYLVGFACIGLAGFFVFNFKPAATKDPLAGTNGSTYTSAAAEKEP